MSTRYYATGRRKTSVARVWLAPGTGKMIINKQPINEYFRRQTLELIVRQPLEYAGMLEKYDVLAIVDGGGWSGQAGAVKMGIARCLVKCDDKFKKQMRDGGFLTRDSREVERKKPGQKKARKRFQFSKR
jgi:small subunit ribosomal protein S9